jgi:ubiquinone/menaquinone biosynthesis C-methylase UbiE
MSKTTLDVEQAVRNRYAEAAKKVKRELCCPVSYDPRLLDAIPEEVLTCDYGCGDPTRYLKPGDTVLDLGSGSGKVCFLASQIVGPKGKVLGVDMNDEMLDVARRSAPIVARNIGYANVEFRKGKIQNLSLDLELLDQRLKETPVRSAEGLSALESEIRELRNSRPLIPDNSVDVVVSNCVLNLVRPQDKRKLFTEILRVLRRGGRAVISDITSDEDIPEELQRNPELWSGCISGAFREDQFLQGFEEAGFYGVTILERQAEPWRTIGGIQFRSVTVAAYKGKEGPCWDQKHAVIYRGPFRQVEDDDGHVLKRGTRTAVCEKTYRIYSQEPYRLQFELVPPRVPVPLEEARPFPCSRGYLFRDPKETKGAGYSVTTEAQTACCVPGNGNGGCC